MAPGNTAPRVTQHREDPNGYIWTQRAAIQCGKSRDWVESRCTVMQGTGPTGRGRNYVCIDCLNNALSEEFTLKPKGD